MQSKQQTHVLGKIAEDTAPILETLSNSAWEGHVYVFMPPETYKGLCERIKADGCAKVNQVYWQEMLQRAHLAALTSVVRQERWFSGAVAAATAKNFLAFAACLRGFLEAAGDTCDSLKGVSLALAQQKASIRKALEGTLSDKPLLWEDLENKLLHFQFAIKQKKDVAPSPAHVAKSCRDYVMCLDKKGENKALQLYDALCVIVHPSEASLSWLYVDEPSRAAQWGRSLDELSINSLCRSHQEAIDFTIQSAVNVVVAVLKTLNWFRVPSVYTPFVDRVDMTRIHLWQKIVQALESDQDLTV